MWRKPISSLRRSMPELRLDGLNSSNDGQAYVYSGSDFEETAFLKLWTSAYVGLVVVTFCTQGNAATRQLAPSIMGPKSSNGKAYIFTRSEFESQTLDQ
jgi:hypothetical protein